MLKNQNQPKKKEAMIIKEYFKNFSILFFFLEF